METPVEKRPETRTSPKATRRERKAQQTRQLILDASKELFSSHPYEDVKMDDIAEQADLSRATLYNYYPSKETIYFEIGIQNLREICERQRTAITPESSGLEQIVRLSEDIMKGLFEEPLDHEIMRHFLVTNSQSKTPADETLKKMEKGEEAGDPSDIILARYLQKIRVFEKIWEEAIELGFRDGSIRHDLKTDQLTHFLFMIISGIIDRVHLERIPLEKMNLPVERIVTLTIDLIRKDLESDRKSINSTR
ncbi:TetR/AcrR family transcriptional regulator [Candidatus Bathyarchaeota archaeon]|nr:TetR/AcrR family transcriptional regulator [Candidatus Bathyarchaeota archaeon]